MSLEHVLYSLAGAVISMLFSVVGFFVARMIHKNDDVAKDSSDLERAFLRELGAVRERIGQVEMRVDACFRGQDALKERFNDLREDVHRGT